MTTRHDITIIGAGIVGIATAVYLQRDGHRVTVVDKGEPGRGTSYGNAGSVAPSSIIPMAMPGTILNIPKWITDPLGPLTISWRRVPSLFALVPAFPCGVHAGRRDARCACAAFSQRRFAGVIQGTARVRGCGRSPASRWHAARVPIEAAFAGTAFSRQLRTELAGEVEIVDAVRIHDLEPSLSPDYRYGFFLRDNGHVRSPLASCMRWPVISPRAAGRLCEPQFIG